MATRTTAKAKPKYEVKITIQGIPWKACFISTKQMVKVYREQPLLGLTDPVKQRIYVDYEHNTTTVLSTFWHEWTHAAVASLQGSMGSQDGMIQEEAAANLVGNAMIEILPSMGDILKLISTLAQDEVED